MDSESEDSIKLEVSEDDDAMDTNLPKVINISRKRKNTKEGICDVCSIYYLYISTGCPKKNAL